MPRLHGSVATPKQSILYGIIVLTIGCLIAISGMNFAYQFFGTYAKSEKIMGHIIRLDLIRQTYRPVVEFSKDGKTYQFTDKQGSKPPEYAVGDPVQVAFPVDQPDQGRIDSILSTWITPLLPLVFSAFFLITGLVMAWSGFSRLKIIR